MSTFTCIACRVAFSDADGQRTHYKSDWHRYNLKRKVADLPPVTAENFKERVQAQQAQLEVATSTSDSHCAICNKHFSSTNQYQNHINSKKHKDLEAKSQDPDKINADRVLHKNEKNRVVKNEDHGASQSEGAEGGAGEAMAVDEDGGSEDGSWESWEGEALTAEECLFCCHASRNIEKNMKHMMTEHSFFIPDIDFVIDLKGLLTYLGEKVGEGYICLWCNAKSKSFRTLKAVQQHMLDKGHCKMFNDGDAVFEYADYYDYRSSYPDYVPGAEEEDTEEVMKEDEDTTEELDGNNYQLVLPSGSVVGHRSLMRYFRQKLRPDRQIVPVNNSCLNRVLAQYKALGWTGSTGPIAQRRAKDMAHFHRVHHRKYLDLGVKANKMQFHFRHQVIF